MGTNYNTINAYDADCRIPEFKGLAQYGNDLNGNPCYATEAWNMETRGGVLQPVSAPVLLAPSLNAPIETIARLHRRWHENPLQRDLIVGATGGKLYWMLPDGNAWTEFTMPTGVTSFQSNVWSWVTYEINALGSQHPTDVLLISNKLDGMYMVNGETLAITAVNTNGKKFGIIERYAERIWGADIPDDPDMLMYSAPYDPTDWQANATIPEDGAGDIQQPSWDGDSFTAIKSFGNQLIAFKKHRVWRIVGTDPGEYTFKEQFGGGCSLPRTIVTSSETILMLGKDGPQVYDGLTVQPYQQTYCTTLYKSMNVDAGAPCGILHKQKYYLAFATGTSTANNCVLVYDMVDGTWLARNDLNVEQWLETEDGLFFTTSVAPGKVMQYKSDSWETGYATGGATKWVSPWNDLNYKSMTKGGFELYVQAEVKTTAATLKISIQTEKKTKTKTYTVQPLTAEQIAAGKQHKQRRIHFGGTGRRFRIIIETEASQTPACWRIVGGLLTIAEVDTD